MTVAAARKNWIPGFFTIIGQVGWKRREEDPSPSTGIEETDQKGSDAPINAVILSAVLGALYIAFGNFRALLTLNGLGEYSFFFLTVLGAIILRYREPGLHRPYKTFAINPLLFVVVSGFVVARGALFAPFQAIIIVVIWIVGVVFYKSRQYLAARQT